MHLPHALLLTMLSAMPVLREKFFLEWRDIIA